MKDIFKTVEQYTVLEIKKRRKNNIKNIYNNNNNGR